MVGIPSSVLNLFINMARFQRVQAAQDIFNLVSTGASVMVQGDCFPYPFHKVDGTYSMAAILRICSAEGYFKAVTGFGKRTNKFQTYKPSQYRPSPVGAGSWGN